MEQHPRFFFFLEQAVSNKATKQSVTCKNKQTSVDKPANY